MKNRKRQYFIKALVTISALSLLVTRVCGEGTGYGNELPHGNYSDPAAAETAQTAAEKTRTSSTLKLYDKSWAVVIGINQYENKKWSTLRYAVADALAVESKLDELGFDEIISLTDERATKRNIEQLLKDRLPYVTKENDRVLVFFAGHGHTRELHGREQGFLIPTDGDYQKNYSSTTISMEDIRNLSSKIPAKHIYYVIDACYSGLGLKPPATSKRDLELKSAGGSFHEGVEGYLNKITSRIAVQIITAGGKNEEAEEGESHGLFTEYFLKGLEGEADRNKDHILTASEIGVYTSKEVSVASDNEQTPGFGWIDGEGEFVFILPGLRDKYPHRDPVSEKKIRKLKLKIENLYIYVDMLERENKRLETLLAKSDESGGSAVESEKQPPEATINPGLEEQKRIMAEIMQRMKSPHKIIKLRMIPSTINTTKIRKQFEAMGFRDVEWNPDGDFPNEYEAISINGDKIVVDYTSGLMWQQSGSINEMLFNETADYVKYNLNGRHFACFDDWRLPTLDELASLIEPVKNNDSHIDNVFDNEQQWLWSCDRKRSGVNWPLSLNTGIIRFADENIRSYVRCVRSLK